MKKIFSIFVAVMAVCSLSAKSLYLDLGVWADSQDPANFKIYTLEETPKWVDMSKVENETNIYSATVGDEITGVIYCRVNPAGTDQDPWKNVWNQTEDLNIPEGKDLFKVTSWNSGKDGKGAGEWSKYGEVTLPAVSVAGDFNNWKADVDVLTPAADNKTASVKVNLTKAQDWGFKVIVDGNWLSASAQRTDIERGADPIEVKYAEGGEGNNLFIKADIAGEYVITWNYAESKVSVAFPELPEITLEDGYYLIGLTGWSIYSLDASLKFSAFEDEARPGQYRLAGVDLKLNDEFKVVEVKDKALTANWYGSGDGNNNFKVTEDFVGKADVYFVATWQNDWNGYIWVAKTQGITNTAAETKAVKTFVNGQLVIIKGDKVFNAIGTQIQ